MLERRRRRAVALLERGLRPSEVAHQVGADVSSVRRWRDAWEQGGDGALAPRPVPGRPAKLNEEQRRQLVEILREGAVASGFHNELWTLKRIAAVIQRRFGVRYHRCHVWKVLRDCNWTCQVPERRAIQRNEEEIAQWKRHRWPAIKKSSAPGGPSGLPR
jgi:transposase